jgi:hypothetical protein
MVGARQAIDLAVDDELGIYIGILFKERPGDLKLIAPFERGSALGSEKEPDFWRLVSQAAL